MHGEAVKKNVPLYYYCSSAGCWLRYNLCQH